MSRRLDTTLRLLLTVLLTGGGFSLGIRHSHPGGERVHHHHGPAAFECSSDEHRAAGRRHEAFDAHDHEALASAPLHRHVFFLGFEFAFPERGPTRGDSRDTTPAAGKSMIVRLVPADLPAVSPAASDVTMAADFAPWGLSVACLVDQPAIRDGCMADASRPLCDTVHDERSGVQLM